MINPITSSIPTNLVQSATPSTTPTDTDNSFGGMVEQGLGNLNGLDTTADNMSTQAATGDLSDVTNYMIASNEAQSATDLTVAVRDKALESFQQIMAMPI